MPPRVSFHLWSSLNMDHGWNIGDHCSMHDLSITHIEYQTLVGHAEVSNAHRTARQLILI